MDVSDALRTIIKSRASSQRSVPPYIEMGQPVLARSLQRTSPEEASTYVTDVD